MNNHIEEQIIIDNLILQLLNLTFQQFNVFTHAMVMLIIIQG